MATARLFAQHFLECENCEEDPAQFLCKTCPGHLCETCKTEHETRKITKTHEIIHLHKDKEGPLGLLYCGKHKVNKIEWYCSPCKEPVCTKCLMESHNGHKMEDFATIYQENMSKLKKEKKEIEAVLLPKYREMISKEKRKKSELSKRNDEVKKQIEDHTKSIMNQVTTLKENALQNLREEEEKAIMEIEDTEHEIEERIETLRRLNEEITNNLGANRGSSFLMNIDSYTLQKMQEFPATVNYKIVDFQPGELFITEDQFGKSPKFSKSEENILQTEQLSNENSDVSGIMRQLDIIELQCEEVGDLIPRMDMQKEIDFLRKSLSGRETFE